MNYKKMKNIECPLCGGVPQFATKQIDEIEVCQILCKCGLATEVNEYWLNPKDDPEEDELRAWKDWEKLVSKFPPIMRVQVGDRIRHVYQFNPYRGTPRIVEEVNVQEWWIRATGNKPILRPNEITTWPWELEEKGEQQ